MKLRASIPSKRYIRHLIYTVIFITFLLNCQNKKYSDRDQELQYRGILIGSSTSDFICDTSPVFAEVYATTSGCLSCHGSSGGYDMATYTSTMQAVTPGSPENSLLYTKIASGGSMNQYSNTQTNNIVYCWILAGAKN